MHETTKPPKYLFNLYNCRLPSIPLYLEVNKQLLDPAKFKSMKGVQLSPEQLAKSLVRQGSLQDLRQHIMAFVSFT